MTISHVMSISHAHRLANSPSGNPRWRIRAWGDEAWTLRTESDNAKVCNQDWEALIGRRVVLTLAPGNIIVDVRTKEEMQADTVKAYENITEMLAAMRGYLKEFQTVVSTIERLVDELEESIAEEEE